MTPKNRYMKLPNEYNNLEKHFTATGYVFNTDMTKTLLVYHKKLQKWMPAGGHVDPGEMPHDAVVREVFEETGVKADFIKLSSIEVRLNPESEWEIPKPYYTMLQLIPENSKQPKHYHYDFIYVLQSSEEKLIGKETEVENLSWFTLEQTSKLDTFSFTQAICKELMF